MEFFSGDGGSNGLLKPVDVSLLSNTVSVNKLTIPEAWHGGDGWSTQLISHPALIETVHYG